MSRTKKNNQSQSRTQEVNSSAENRGNKRTNRNMKGSKNVAKALKEKIAKFTGEKPCIITNSDAPNDPAWYKNYAALYPNVANFPYSTTVGLPGNASNGVTVPGYTAGLNRKTVRQVDFGNIYPGLMTIEYTPTIGVCTDVTDAPNIAMQQFYTLVRKQNSGSNNNIDPVDYMKLVVAMDNAYMLYEDLVRAYRICGTFQATNRYWPLRVGTALGYDVSKLCNELADFRAAIDLFAYQLASINIPDQFDFIKRHSWMNTNIYTDSAQHKAQLYAFKQLQFFVWLEDSTDPEQMLNALLRYQLFGEEIVTSVESIRNAINTMMVPLLGSQDVGVISGDIAKAFGDGGMIKMKAVENYATIEPAFSDEVLTQIENLEIIPVNLASCAPKQNYRSGTEGPFLTCKPIMSTSNFTNQGLDFANFRWVWQLGFNHLLNMHKDNPSQDDNLVATRLKVVLEEGETSGTINVKSSGTEIVHHCTIHGMGPDGLDVEYDINNQFTFIPTNAELAGNDLSAELAPMYAMTNFDWAPTTFIMKGESESDYGYLTAINCDLDNFTWLSHQDVATLNDVCVMSEFAVKDYNYNI